MLDTSEDAAVETSDAVDSYANSDAVDADSKLFRKQNGRGYPGSRRKMEEVIPEELIGITDQMESSLV